MPGCVAWLRITGCRSCKCYSGPGRAKLDFGSIFFSRQALAFGGERKRSAAARTPAALPLLLGKQLTSLKTDPACQAHPSIFLMSLLRRAPSTATPTPRPILLTSSWHWASPTTAWRWALESRPRALARRLARAAAAVRAAKAARAHCASQVGDVCWACCTTWVQQGSEEDALACQQGNPCRKAWRNDRAGEVPQLLDGCSRLAVVGGPGGKCTARPSALTAVHSHQRPGVAMLLPDLHLPVQMQLRPGKMPACLPAG
jgi:hypothetical protein